MEYEKILEEISLVSSVGIQIPLKVLLESDFENRLTLDEIFNLYHKKRDTFPLSNSDAENALDYLENWPNFLESPNAERYIAKDELGSYWLRSRGYNLFYISMFYRKFKEEMDKDELEIETQLLWEDIFS